MHWTLKLGIIGLVALAASGCSERRVRGDASASERISADTGGTVTAGAHKIEIPAEALPGDTDISLAVVSMDGYPALENVEGGVLVIEPEGTVLGISAMVTLPVGAIGETTRVSVQQLLVADEGMAWSPVEASIDSVSGTATVGVTRLAPLAVVKQTVDVTAAGQIAGTVTWGSGDAASGAPVELYLSLDAPALTTVTTDEAGAYQFSDLTPGTYIVAINYECNEYKTVEVTAGATATADIVLCGG